MLIDATAYLKRENITAKDLAMRIILDVLRTTGITATAGIGPNLYLAKIAMDIYAKHVQPDENGVRIAELDEMKYRQLMWTHRPLTDFWRVGKGYEKKLESIGLYTMGDIARCSLGAPTDLYNEDTLYDLFGVNCALPGFVDSKNEEKTERNAGYLVVSHSGGGMLRQGTRKGIRRTPANRGMRAHWVVKGLDISEDVCHGMCP